MRRILLALFILTWASSAQAFTDCTGPIQVLASATVPTAVWEIPPILGGKPSAWLEIVNAGGGSASVAINAYGPKDPAGVAADRATFLLGTLTAATTYVSNLGNVQGLQAVVTGCTTTCDLRISLCGTNDAAR